MALRRKLAFSYGSTSLPTSAKPPVYLNRHPEADYEPVGVPHGTWVGVHRRRMARQLAVVQEVQSSTITDFSRMAEIVHLNIARPLGLYYIGDEAYIVHEFTELDLFGVLPLSEVEIASVMAQLFSGISYLMVRFVGFRIATVRISVYGVVKIVLDWNCKPAKNPCPGQSNHGLMAAFMDETMTTLGESIPRWSQEASDFLDILKSGCLPHVNHPFLAKSKGEACLKAAVKFAIRRTLARGVTGDMVDSKGAM